jgi:uroporphyrin-III C-methyltransferase
VRGLRVLQQADVVLHDALIHPDLLHEAKPSAKLLAVGKRGYCIGSTRQEHIHTLLVEAARGGNAVCRLKGGDPCLFGRGGEEAEVLAAAGIPYEIVPGVTAALAACASAKIPLTHRAVGQSLALVTGHFDPASEGCTLDWSALRGMSTVIFYMAVRHLPAIMEKLLSVGVHGELPVAIIESATLLHERVITGQLHDLARLCVQYDVQAPAIVILGDVVTERTRLTQMTGDVVKAGVVGHSP